MNLMELKDKRVLVVGLGKSGVASALFLKAHGARVTVSDTKSGDELRNEIPALLDHGITVETGGHGERTFRGQDLIVVSPGVPVDAPPVPPPHAANASPGAAKASAATKAAPANNAPYEGVRLCLRLMVCI